MGYLGDLYGAERTLLLMREEEANELQEADRHGTAVPDRVAFSLTGRLVAWLEVNEVPLWLDRYGEVLDHLTATERDVLLKHRVGMCLPLMAMNRLVGLVLLGGLQWPEREVAPHILTQMGLALQNAVLYGQQQLRLRRLSRSERLATTGELAASAAHEIRNPLTAISSAVQVLGEAFPEGNPRRQVADNVMREIDRINQIVEGLLSFSRPTEEKREAVNLRPVLEEATRLAESSARPVNAPAIFKDMDPVFSGKVTEKNITFAIEVDAKVPRALILDETRLRQVMINLIGNAVKFTDEGGVTVSARVEDEKGGRIDLVASVKDTGVGIPEDQQDKIFGAFEQTSGQSYTKFGGTGLGLAITRQLVELMGGEISVESTLGQGSTFHVRLRDVEIASKDVLSGSEDGDVANVRFEPATVLVADDVDANRQLVTAYLEPTGLSTLEVANGEEAVEIARQHGPDLIVMDIRMPVLDGYEATKILREGEETKEIPIVILTASVMKEDEGAIRAISDGYLKKPVTKSELVTELMRFLAHTNTAVPDSDDGVDAASDAGGDWSVDALSQAARALLPQLAVELEGPLQQTWESLNGSMIAEVETFALEMQQLGAQYEFRPLVAWGELLHGQASTFQLDLLPETLAHYPELVRQVTEGTRVK